MLKELKCDLCGSISQKVIYKSKKLNQNSPYFITETNLSPPSKIACCNSCGLIFAVPMQNDDAFLNAYVKMADKKYIEEEFGRRLSARSILKKLNRFKRHGNRLLDIGCSTGFLLDEARNIGWDVYGVELSTWASQYANEKFNLKVYNTTLKKANLPCEYFDAVIMQDTIEHLLHPAETILEIKRVLKASGILYINTPDIESLASRFLKAKWWGINQFHLYYFSKRSLTMLLRLCGFNVVKYDLYARTFTLAYWAKRFKNYNHLIYKILILVTKIGIFKKTFLRVNLRDQIEVFATKK